MPMTPQETAQHLYEIEQIQQTKARYFRFLDTKQWADWRTCFTDDLHFYLGQDQKPLAASADEFVAYVSKLLADTVTVHHGHMPEITLTSATTATGIWAMFDWVDWSQTATPERTFQGYGHYHEEYAKGADGRWRIPEGLPRELNYVRDYVERFVPRGYVLVVQDTRSRFTSEGDLHYYPLIHDARYPSHILLPIIPR